MIVLVRKKEGNGCGRSICGSDAVLVAMMGFVDPTRLQKVCMVMMKVIGEVVMGRR